MPVQALEYSIQLQFMRVSASVIVFFLFLVNGYGQVILSGTVKDEATNKILTGATVMIKNSVIGSVTGYKGEFVINYEGVLPVALQISFLGFETQDFIVESDPDKIKIVLVPDDYELDAVEVKGSRISDKQKENPLTVESMDIIAIKETPSADFYEGLGHLKGVDLTSASIGFKVVNTRGFNSTSPVRSLQIIDNVDNQAPGLNFSLGNFLGSSELDLQRVELVVGASSAFYGPNAFNGVISMTTKDPFIHKGLTVMAKGGERALGEFSLRYADVIKNKNGRDKFGFKFNAYFMRANDWEAMNLDSSTSSYNGPANPGGYDAVNRYADENRTEAVNNATSKNLQVQFPGLGRFYRTGYLETDLADYDTRNFKANLGLFYKIRKDINLIYSFNFGSGTTVYQGDNRFSLKGIRFYQNRLEINKPNRFFIRAYATHEDAGKSYDIVRTAYLLQERGGSDFDWSVDYSNYWQIHMRPKVKALPEFPPDPQPPDFLYDFDMANAALAQNIDLVTAWHQETRDYADKSRLVPGTKAFEDAFNQIISKRSGQGGTGFYDKSALYHIHGEYKMDFDFADITVGSNYRTYRPKSDGTIFSDTNGVTITNFEYGIYTGLEKAFLKAENLKFTFSIRYDKNQNFNGVFSPAFSLVYVAKENHVFRASLSSALRNPTLSDQFLYFNVGPAYLVGNITGFNHLATIESLSDYLNSPNLDTSLVTYFNVDPIQPELLKTIEFGYRGLLFNSLYLDASYYHSWYRDFIGYEVGADVTFENNRIDYLRIYRVASNATDKVTTQGFTIGLNYYFQKYFVFSANYSWNKLDKKGSDDPIIPAYNTPEHKYNVNFSGRDINTRIGSVLIKNWGFGINLKYVEGFTFEGSPQFTGPIPSYYMVDAQINKRVPKWKTTFKLGASNLLNHKVHTVYGGPLIGRLAYFSVLVELVK